MACSHLLSASGCWQRGSICTEYSVPMQHDTMLCPSPPSYEAEKVSAAVGRMQPHVPHLPASLHCNACSRIGSITDRGYVRIGVLAYRYLAPAYGSFPYFHRLTAGPLTSTRMAWSSAETGRCCTRTRHLCKSTSGRLAGTGAACPPSLVVGAPKIYWKHLQIPMPGNHRFPYPVSACDRQHPCLHRLQSCSSVLPDPTSDHLK